MFSALESGKINVLFFTFFINLIISGLYIALCYLNNVHLDMNTFKLLNGIQIKQMEIYHKLKLNDTNKELEKGDVYNIIEQSSKAFSTVISQYSKLFTNLLILVIFAISIYMLSPQLFMLLLLTCGGVVILTTVLKIVINTSERQKQMCLGELESCLNELIACLDMRCFGENILNYNNQNYQAIRKKIWKLIIIQDFCTFCLEEATTLIVTLGKGSLLVLSYPAYLAGIISYELIAGAVTAFDNIKRIVTSFFNPVKEILKNKIILARYYDIANEPIDEVGKIEEIEIKNLTYKKEQVILDNISISFKTNEKVALIGFNGSGKTTLLKAILSSLSEGKSTFYNSYNISLNNTILRNNFSYIPNQPLLFNCTVLDNIDLNLEGQYERIHTLELDMDNEKDKNAQELSTGQKQRVNVLRGLYNKNKFLIADEPDANIPLALCHKMMELIQCNAQGCLIITHNPKLIGYFDKVIFLKEGHLAFQGATEQFMKSTYYDNWCNEK